MRGASTLSRVLRIRQMGQNSYGTLHAPHYQEYEVTVRNFVGDPAMRACEKRQHVANFACQGPNCVYHICAAGR